MGGVLPATPAEVEKDAEKDSDYDLCFPLCASSRLRGVLTVSRATVLGTPRRAYRYRLRACHSQTSTWHLLVGFWECLLAGHHRDAEFMAAKHPVPSGSVLRVRLPDPQSLKYEDYCWEQ